MVILKTADGGFEIVDGCVAAPEEPGLGIVPRLDVLGEPVASYTSRVVCKMAQKKKD